MVATYSRSSRPYQADGGDGDGDVSPSSSGGDGDGDSAGSTGDGRRLSELNSRPDSARFLFLENQ